MSYADKVFCKNARDILTSKIDDTCFEVRPKWKDGTPAHTKKILHQQNKYILEENSIPVMTLRKTGFKNAIDEILWIYQKSSNRISDLNSHIWDSWNVGDGTIGKAYGYQIGLISPHHIYKHDELSELNSGFYKSYQITNINGNDWVCFNQMDSVLYDLKHNPGSRSIMTNTFNHSDLYAMGLRPCAFMMQYNVTKDTDGSMVLNGQLNQRSQDMLTANNWNVIQYAVLMQMIAHVCDMKVGQFTHVVADMHIYDRHEPIVKEMIDEYDNIYRFNSNIDSIGSDDIPYENPIFEMDRSKKSFYDFNMNDFNLKNYEYLEFNHKIEVAV